MDIYNQSMEKLQNMKGKQLQLLIVILPDVTDSYGKQNNIDSIEIISSLSEKFGCFQEKLKECVKQN